MTNAGNDGRMKRDEAKFEKAYKPFPNFGLCSKGNYNCLKCLKDEPNLINISFFDHCTDWGDIWKKIRLEVGRPNSNFL